MTARGKETHVLNKGAQKGDNETKAGVHTDRKRPDQNRHGPPDNSREIGGYDST